jgi:peptidoglycan hydrolase-like protein with peptidoglycan-binding domain
MNEITPRFGMPLDLPRKERDLEAPDFHRALNNARGPDGQGTGHGTSGIGLGVTGQMYGNFLGFGAGGLGAPGGGAGGAGGFGASKPVLSKGSNGADVQTAEDQINGWRAENGRKPIKADGKYNQETETAVRDFQKANKLEIDGSIGANTHDRLQLENDASFKNIDPATKTLVRDQMNANAKNQVGRESMLQLAIDPNLAKLPPDAQQNYVKKLGANPANLQQIRDNVKDRATLEKDPNFQKLDPVTQKNVREKIEKYDGKPVERGLLLKLATDPNFEKLGGAANRDRALKALGNNPTSAANLTNLQKMIGSDSFKNKMDGGFRGQMLDLAAGHAGDNGYTQDLSKLVSDPKFGALGPVDQGKTINVFKNTTAAGRTALQDLLQREVNGVSALKSHGVAKNAPTLLDELDRLTSSPITDVRLRDGAGQPVTPAQYSEQLLQEVSAPDNFVDQSNRSTCTCTSISHKLAAKNPAEYARIATDLALTGQSKLANGAAINVPGPNAWPADSSTRSHSERLIQSSLMNYARPGKTYVNNQGGGGSSPDGWADRPGSGLTSDEESRVMQGLYNKPFEAYNGDGIFGSKKDIMNKIRGELGRGVSHVNVDLKWGPGGHAVEVIKIQNVGSPPTPRVFIRNPHGNAGVGPTGTIQGTVANNSNGGPLRRTEDNTKAIQSMSLADFEKAVENVYVDR